MSSSSKDMKDGKSGGGDKSSSSSSSSSSSAAANNNSSNTNNNNANNSSGGSGNANFLRDNGGIVGGMTDKVGEGLIATASASVPPATAAQIAAWNAAWPNVSPLLKDFETSVKYFNAVSKKELSGQKKTVHTVGWNCSGARLASGSVDQTARVWNIDHKGVHQPEIELKGHTDRVDQLCWSPASPDLLATASIDKTVRIWDARSGRCVHNIPTKGQNINITWSPDANFIAVGNNKDVVSIIDCKTFKITKEQKFQSEVNEMVWNKSCEYFVVTTGTGSLDVLAFPSFELKHSVEAHTGHCYCVEFDPEGKYLATGGADAFVTLWSLSELVCVRTFDRSDSPIRGISFSHTGQFIAAASEDFRIEISDVESGEHVYTLKTRAETNSLMWNPRYLLLAYAIDDKAAGSVSVFGFPSTDGAAVSGASSAAAASR